MYQVWSIFSNKPIFVLVTLALICVIVALGAIVGRKKTIDKLFSATIVSYITLFMVLTFLDSLNAGLSPFYPHLFTMIPALSISVTAPLLGFLAFIIILGKGILVDYVLNFKRSILERLCLIFGLGIGLTSYQTMILSITHLLYRRWVVTLDIIVLTSLAIIVIFTKYRRSGLNLTSLPNLSLISLSKLDIISISMVLYIISIFLICVYYSIQAITEWDSLAYIAYYAKLIYLNHGVLNLSGPAIGLEMSANYPIGYQAIALHFYNYLGHIDDFYMRIWSPISYALLLLATYCLSREFFENIKYRIGSVLLTMATPLLYLYALGSGHYLPYLTFLTTLAILYLIKFIEKNSTRLLIISSILIGLGTTVNYIAFLSISFLLLAIVLRRKNFLKNLFIISFINIIMPMPYLWRNFTLLNDPFYPFLTYSNDELWALREKHFDLMCQYTGLKVDSPFSVLNFLLTRGIGIRPWGTIVLIILPLFLLYVWRVKAIKLIKPKEKLLLIFLLLSFIIFLIKPTFERYLLPYIAIYACTFMWMLKTSNKINLFKLNVALKTIILYSLITLILSFSLVTTLSATLRGYTEIFEKRKVLDVYDFLAYFYNGDADCWKWLNEHTKQGEKILTFEIRNYYIKPEVIYLDGNLAKPLYRKNMTIEKALDYLKSLNIKYVLTTSWASPMSKVHPAGYRNNIVNKYLGDPRYFPCVYSKASTAVYHVGSVNLSNIVNYYAARKIILPILNYSFTIRGFITDNIDPPTYMIYINIPCDYHKNIFLHLNAYTNLHNVSLEIWRGKIDVKRRWQEKFFGIASKPWPANSGLIDPSLTWLVKGGSYTIVVRSWDPYLKPIPIELSIRFEKVKLE